VIRFQRGHRLPATGWVGPATMTKLRQVAAANARRAARHPARHPARRPARRPAPSIAVRALWLAASQRGKPYVLGAVGPNAFDCSGFTRWVYGRLGKRLPRTSYAQYAVTHVPRSQVRPGDLVFSADLSHVGIYAGWGTMWNAPHTGARVRLQKVWDHGFRVGRVR
jgi:cell wall-associated NlpC family hydrolase